MELVNKLGKNQNFTHILTVKFNIMDVFVCCKLINKLEKERKKDIQNLSQRKNKKNTTRYVSF